MPKYNHAEAFCLMQYQCNCGHNELVWNSRDGVTPFSMQCPSCGSFNLRHDHWERDTCKPAHVPHNGQLVFRDGTMAEACSIVAGRYFASQKEADPNHRIPEAIYVEQIKNIQAGTSDSFRPGWPIVTRHNVKEFKNA